MEIKITQPDDWHIHLREDDALGLTVKHVGERYGRALVMPNLKQPVTNIDSALAYRQRILQQLPEGSDFQPFLTLYLNEQISEATLNSMAEHESLLACKLYPAGATTHSDLGVENLEHIYPLLEIMEKLDIPLCIHGEVTDEHVDVFDREKVFLEKHLSSIIHHFPALRISLEHITTRDAVSFVLESGPKIAATITAHHLHVNRNALLSKTLKPHYFCLPVLKRVEDQDALINAAISGNPKFFLGSDSAPHARSMKETACGCAGIYTGHGSLELYAEIFDALDAMDKLEGFASNFGADFYGVKRNDATLRLAKKSWDVPECYPFGDEVVIPFRANETIHWKIITDEMDEAATDA